MQITSASIVVAARDQISCDFADEAAVLNLKSGVYFGLDDVAATVWHLIQKPVSVADICAVVTGAYAVSAAQAEADIIELLDQMMHEGLVEVTPDEASAR